MKVLMPRSLEEACDLFARTPGAVPLAGATDLFAHWHQRPTRHQSSYLDLSKIESMKRLSWTPGAMSMGAGVTYWQTLNDPAAAAEFPLLSEASRQVGAIQIQSRGTWAGNIANASPAADGVPVLMAYDAQLVLVSVRGERRVPLRSFYTGYKTSVRAADELIGAIELPRRTYRVAQFHKVGQRRAQAITKVGLVMTCRDGVCESPWSVVAVSLAPCVKCCPNVERVLCEGSPSYAKLADAANADIAPIDDIRSTAAYRREVFCRVLWEAVRNLPPL